MKIFGKALGVLLSAAMTVSLGTGVIAAPAQAAEKSINIGWTAWSDAEAVTKLAKAVIEERYGYKVELTMADIGIQYQGIASGKLDAMLMSWQPLTHKPYLDKVGKDVVDLGPLYTRARLGWVVPDYIPVDQVKSIEDLKKPDVQQKLGGKIQGIDPGSGLMQASEKALKTYDLKGLQLVSASDAAMLAALERAMKRNEWIVVTSWSPHWMFANWKLRYLDDPKGALGGLESVNAIVRKGFYQDHPEIFEFLNRMVLPIGDLEAMMQEARQTSYEQAVDNYIKNNKARVDYWVTGKL
ncbi:glycine betaine ABC transporter substrate-binding protein [Azospirillum sp. CT11-132]|jgi:glycine betaine/proline transport system substrate-binding protein|uniref:glycine betaine ABC transporter substrate-binding protein n=1 Tax=unclassified Azospirillum TaxID=2630922 RepID=UPI000D6061DA|nr:MULTISPECIES: glycine betaine ABC transporter substrate-binding protein [unclassified Azospirillum]MCM8735858.1 glycine betaine ABC transporter substrate-binding protein [Azospirillum sp. A1-3]PWC54988.1 glycine/betaine ABC transporter substrate-binding protein [Azospirillum sp. TSH7]PWC61691.1 glycine/betaine ABC transporter substrate-binding protein [Azospirillum sp. TSH20]QCG94781.1 glycine betaine ABC transporter substrate-binding protein [Azospirillum sp. TSA2s]